MRIFDCFNTPSPDVAQAKARFKELALWKQITTVVIAAIAGLATLGFAALPTFCCLVNRFHPLNLQTLPHSHTASRTHSAAQATPVLPTRTAVELPQLFCVEGNQYRNGNPAACTGLSLRLIERCIQAPEALSNIQHSLAQVYIQHLLTQVLGTSTHTAAAFQDTNVLIQNSQVVKSPDFPSIPDQLFYDTINLVNPDIEVGAGALFDSRAVDAALFTCNGITVGAYNTKKAGWIFFDSHGIENPYGNREGLSSRNPQGEVQAYAAVCSTKAQFINYLKARFPSIPDGGELLNTMAIYPLVRK